MDPSRSAMQVALRVLVAITRNERPDPGDIGKMRLYFPSLAELPAEELACRVIHQVIERRTAEARRYLKEGE